MDKSGYNLMAQKEIEENNDKNGFGKGNPRACFLSRRTWKDVSDKRQGRFLNKSLFIKG